MKDGDIAAILAETGIFISCFYLWGWQVTVLVFFLLWRFNIAVRQKR